MDYSKLSRQQLREKEIEYTKKIQSMVQIKNEAVQALEAEHDKKISYFSRIRNCMGYLQAVISVQEDDSLTGEFLEDFGKSILAYIEPDFLRQCLLTKLEQIEHEGE